MTALRILSIATLFPDSVRSNFGLFVEKSLAALASEPDVELTIIAPVGLPPWPLSLHPRYRALTAIPLQEQWHGLTVHRPRFRLIPRIGARFNPAQIARAALPIARRLKQTRGLDVIDAQFFYPDGPAAMRIAQALHLPFSIKARGADISHFGHDPATKGQVLTAANQSAAMLAVSDAMRRDMEAIGIHSGKIGIHYTGVDLTHFCPGNRAAARARHGLGEGPIILTVGALIPRKGQALVIDALPALPDTLYLIAGEGEAETAYRARAKALGVLDRVRFLGPVPNKELPDLYRAADAVVMPSVSEGLANAWVEALACGTPIVISDAGGAAELVTNDMAGHIVERTSVAIAAAVQTLLSNPPVPSAVAGSLSGRFDWARNGRELAAHLRACAKL